MPAALPLGVRNRLAELILDAFDSHEARAVLEALAAWCGEGEANGDGAARLRGLGWFEQPGGARIRLVGAHRPRRAALCRRARAAVAMLSRGVPFDAGTVTGLLGRAALLADAGLYFEVHELLEPRWMCAEGDERVALQGLIQVAVALHHAESGNRPGAIALMQAGLAKLETTHPALPLATARWVAGLARTLAAWRDGTPPPPAPPWPAPTEAAWRSC
jgi:hypothetical protein